MRMIFVAATILFCNGSLVAQDEKIDLGMVQKIREEGLNNSKVMDIVFYLTDVNGPRLQGSPGYMKAANWAKGKLKAWGLENAMLEPWGDWGKGWELQRSYVAMSAPYYKPLIAYPKSWTAGTNGLQLADVVMITAADSMELMVYKGKLNGKLLIFPRNDTLKPSYMPDGKRRTDEELQTMADYDPAIVSTRSGNNSINRARPPQLVNMNTLRNFAKNEGAVGLLSASTNGHDGTLFVSGGGSYSTGAPENMLDIMLAYEDYMMIYRLIKASIPVKVEVDIKTKFFMDDLKGYNVVAEIKGTDKKLKDELVMVGGHLDSWHSSMGATDNAAGCAVMMEVIRILKTLGVTPRRTIRIALWGGEEQGLHGSRNYVRNHFMDTLAKKPNTLHEKFDVYFNLDNGTGKIRGVYLQNNPAVKSIFTKWLEPFNDLGAKTVTLQNTGGTDHLSFDGIGLPGFQFIQDEIEYNTRTHHTNMDTYDHLQPDDLKQAATIIAWFVYNAAQRDEKIPRKVTVVKN